MGLLRFQVRILPLLIAVWSTAALTAQAPPAPDGRQPENTHLAGIKRSRSGRSHVVTRFLGKPGTGELEAFRQRGIRIVGPAPGGVILSATPSFSPEGSFAYQFEAVSQERLPGV